MALDHVTLPTRQFDATVEFLSQVLEFPEIESPSDVSMRACWFEVGDGQAIHVLEIERAPDTQAEREFGRHVAFRFPHARWLRLKSQLERHSIEIIPPRRPSSTSRFFICDPNGYCFEFIMQ